MTGEVRHPPPQPDDWATQHETYHRTARHMLSQARDLDDWLGIRRSMLTQEISAQEPTWEAPAIQGHVNRLTAEDAERLDVLCVSTQVFACMAVETFVNSYGARRFRESFSERQLRRLAIYEKLSIILGPFSGQRGDEDNEVALTVRQMFLKRERLTHPRPASVGPENGLVLPEAIDPLEQAEQAIDEMFQFFGQFRRLDRNAVPQRLTAEID